MAKSKSALKLTTSNILTCLAYAVIGVLLCVFQSGSLNILMTIVGALFIVLGIMDVIKNKQTIRGIIEIALGAVVIVCGWLVVDIVLLVLGVILIVKGTIELVQNYKAGFVANLSSIMLLVMGVLLVISKWALVDVMCIIVGVLFVINGVLALFGKTIKVKK